jgi:hypothetical protein
LLCENLFTLKSSQMKKNEELQKEVQETSSLMPLLNTKEIRISTKVARRLRNIIYLTSLAGIGLLFNSCVGGYVANEPAYVEYDRPQRPSNAHIWINGDWNYNRQSHMYVQKTGYWEQPRHGQTYVSGQWQINSRGKHWSKGHWQKQGRHR